MIGSGTDGLATHHSAMLGALFGVGGTVGGGYTMGGRNTGGLGINPNGDGTLVEGGLGVGSKPVGDGGLGS